MVCVRAVTLVNTVCSLVMSELRCYVVLQGSWSPALNICTLLTTIQLLMSEPNPDDPLMLDIVRTVSASLSRNNATINVEYNTHTCIIRTPNFDGKIVGNVSLAAQCAPFLRHPIQTC